MAQSRSTVDAAALQDHRVRSLGLCLDAPIRMRTSRMSHTDRQCRTVCQTSSKSVWKCEHCTLENTADSENRCRACFQPHALYRKRLTLAQKRGLVLNISNQLSHQEWRRCEEQAEVRGDLRHACAICREPLGAHSQIMLSCSHIFHRCCLASFERFVRACERVCPICRKSNYQKKLTNKGSQVYRELSATQLQALYRGYQARKKIWIEWKKFYADGNGNNDMRKTFLSQRVKNVTNDLIKSMHHQNGCIDQMLIDCDRAIELSRRVLASCVIAKEQVCLEKPGLSGNKGLDRVEWEDILAKVLSRDEDCAICIQSLRSGSLALLNCAHMYHEACLEGFEAVNIYELMLCPMCRNPYVKKILQPLAHA